MNAVDPKKAQEELDKRIKEDIEEKNKNLDMLVEKIQSLKGHLSGTLTCTLMVNGQFHTVTLGNHVEQIAALKFLELTVENNIRSVQKELQ